MMERMKNMFGSSSWIGAMRSAAGQTAPTNGDSQSSDTFESALSELLPATTPTPGTSLPKSSQTTGTVEAGMKSISLCSSSQIVSLRNEREGEQQALGSETGSVVRVTRRRVTRREESVSIVHSSESDVELGNDNDGDNTTDNNEFVDALEEPVAGSGQNGACPVIVLDSSDSDDTIATENESDNDMVGDEQVADEENSESSYDSGVQFVGLGPWLIREEDLDPDEEVILVATSSESESSPLRATHRRGHSLTNDTPNDENDYTDLDEVTDDESPVIRRTSEITRIRESNTWTASQSSRGRTRVSSRAPSVNERLSGLSSREEVQVECSESDRERDDLDDDSGDDGDGNSDSEVANVDDSDVDDGEGEAIDSDVDAVSSALRDLSVANVQGSAVYFDGDSVCEKDDDSTIERTIDTGSEPESAHGVNGSKSKNVEMESELESDDDADGLDDRNTDAESEAGPDDDLNSDDSDDFEKDCSQLGSETGVQQCEEDEGDISDEKLDCAEDETGQDSESDEQQNPGYESVSADGDSWSGNDKDDGQDAQSVVTDDEGCDKNIVEVINDAADETVHISDASIEADACVSDASQQRVTRVSAIEVSADNCRGSGSADFNKENVIDGEGKIARTNIDSIMSKVNNDSSTCSTGICGRASDRSSNSREVSTSKESHCETECMPRTPPTPGTPQTPRASRTPRAIHTGRTPRTPVVRVEEEAVSRVVLKMSEVWLGSEGAIFSQIRVEAGERLLCLLDREVLKEELVYDKRGNDGDRDEGRVDVSNSRKGGGKRRVTLGWNGRLCKTAGVTHLTRTTRTWANGTKEENRCAIIELSEKVIDEPIRLYHTLAHEMCHAAAWIFDGVSKPPHGEIFKRWARKFCLWDATLSITTCHSYDIRYPFVYQCTQCDMSYGRHSRSIKTDKQACGRCKGRLFLKQRSRDGR